MSYRLGVDLGTAYSSAAVAVDGRARMVPLGNRSAVLPSVVLLRADGAVIVGEAADRRGMAEPDRVAREFKRRFGDPTPFDLGGTKLLAEQLMARLLIAIYQATLEREGGAPDRLALTHPATWGSQKRQSLLAAVQDAATEEGLTLPPIMLVSEPEAAAIYYAESEHIELGEVVAVYDLGGGTFDAALLRRSPAGFEPLGPPEGIDRLGGVDFDAAVYAHVNRFLEGAIDGLDQQDPAVAAGLARLRADCVEAKEALSADTDVTIPVLLPGLRTDLRLTRSELESMIRPALRDTIGALQRALRAAHVVPADVRVVLLVGGSSRIPLVAQLVGNALGRPVAVDVHPKHAVALGAALAADAAHQAEDPPTDAPPGLAQTLLATPPGPPTNTATPAIVPPTSPTSPTVPTPPMAAPGASSIRPPAPASPMEAAPATPPMALAGMSVPAAAAGLSSAGVSAAAATPVAQAEVTATTRGPTPRGGQRESGTSGGGPKRTALLGALAVLVVVLVGLVVVLNRGEEPGPTGSGAPDTTASPQASIPNDSTEVTGSSTVPPPSVTPSAVPEPTITVLADPADLPLPEDCQNRPSPFVCALAVHFDEEDQLVVPFRTQGFTADVTARHIHFFFPNYPEIAEDPNNAGFGGTKPASHWILWDDPNPFGGPTAYGIAAINEIAATEICVLVADAQHRVTPGTGNCLALPPPPN